MSHLLDSSAKGVYTISATPFTDSGDIDWPSVDSLVEFYLQCRVQGLTVLGMMGEAQKLSDQESAEFTRRFLRCVNDRVPVIVGVSNPGTANLVKLSKVAMDAGACGVMVAPLTGMKTEAQIVTYFADVIAALGEKIPVVYQDYPQSTQADISAQSFLKVVDTHPSVVMFKHEDCPGLKKLTQIRTACDGSARRYISILVGNGGLYVPQELARGADGVMTGFAYPEMLVSVCALFAAGRSDEAEDFVSFMTSAAGGVAGEDGSLICRSCAMNSSRDSGLLCAKKFSAGAAPSGRPRCVRRVRSSTPTMWPSSTGCSPASKRG